MGLLFFTMANWSTPLCIKGHKTNKQQFAFVLHICKARSCSSRRVQILGQEWQGTVTQRWETQNQNHCGFNWLNTNGQEAGRPAGDVQDHRHCPWLLLKLNLTDLIAWYCWENREAQSLLQTNCQTNSNYCLKWYRAAPGYKLHHLQPSRTSWLQDYRPGRKSRSESCENLYLIYSFRISVWHISDIETWLTGPIFLKPDAPLACWLNVRFHFLCLRLQIECSEISMQPRYFHDIFGPVDLHLTTFNFKVWNSRHLSCSASAFSCSYRNSNIAIPMLSSWC